MDGASVRAERRDPRRGQRLRAGPEEHARTRPPLPHRLPAGDLPTAGRAAHQGAGPGRQAAGGWEGWPDGGVDAAIAQRWNDSYVRGTNKAGASGLLRGHYTGHMLSMFALSYASTHDEAILARAKQLVDGLEECREAMADGVSGISYSHPGFLSAYGEWQFSALEEYAPYGEIWAPYYTLAKILAGWWRCTGTAATNRPSTSPRGSGTGSTAGCRRAPSSSCSGCGRSTSAASTAA
nr:beta-L-arabinofuranosidase domain-containing protein [Tessaracoccus coleopterorum]